MSMAGRGKSRANDPDRAPLWAIHEITDRLVLLEWRFYLFQITSTHCVQYPPVGIQGYSAAQERR